MKVSIPDEVPQDHIIGSPTDFAALDMDDDDDEDEDSEDRI